MHVGFKFDLTASPLAGRLIYRSSEYSVDFIDCSREEVALSAGAKGCCSLAVGTLQIEVGVETGRLLYPWGLCNLAHLESKCIPIKTIERAGIYIDSGGVELAVGAAVELPGSICWRMFKDVATGWICIGNFDMSAKVRLIQFATNAMISLCGEAVIAVWIKPEVEP